MDAYVLLRYDIDNEDIEKVIGVYLGLDKAKEAARNSTSSKISGWLDTDTKWESLVGGYVAGDESTVPVHFFEIHKTQLIR